MTPVTFLTDRLRSIANWRTLTTSGLVFVLAAAALFASPAPFSLPTVAEACGQVAPDVRFYTSAEDLRGFLDGCGSEGRAAYRNLQLADLAYPSIAGLFPALALMLLLDRRRQRRPLGWDLTPLALLPLLGAAFDYAENAVAWTALAAHPDDSPLASLFGVASIAKQSVSWASWALLLAGLILTGVALIQRRRSSSRPTRRQSHSSAHGQAGAMIGHDTGAASAASQTPEAGAGVAPPGDSSGPAPAVAGHHFIG
jgi:hypothetical protein